MKYITKLFFYLFVSSTMMVFGYEAVKFARDQVRITNGQTLSRAIQYYQLTEHRLPPSGSRENVSQFLFDRKLTDKMVRIFFDRIKAALSAGDKVEIRGFGSFTLKKYKGYIRRNPKTGETVEVKPKQLPVFRTGKNLRSRVNQ